MSLWILMKIRGMHRAQRCFNFISNMEACGLSDSGFVGPRYTWCNNRRHGKRIWNRFDRVLVSDLWDQKFHTNTVSTYLELVLIIDLY